MPTQETTTTTIEDGIIKYKEEEEEDDDDDDDDVDDDDDDSSALLDLACQHSWQQGKNTSNEVWKKFTVLHPERSESGSIVSPDSKVFEACGKVETYITRCKEAVWNIIDKILHLYLWYPPP